MSASSEEDYQSAEDREDGENGINITRVSKDLEGACLSEKDGNVGSEMRSSCSSNGGKDMGGVTEPDSNRTTDSTVKEVSPDSQDKPTSEDSQKPVELTEEEITVGTCT